MGEDSLLERVTAAAEERQLSQNSLIAYRRTWLKIIAWAAAEGLVLETFPVERVDVLWVSTGFFRIRPTADCGTLVRWSQASKPAGFVACFR